MPVLGKVGLVNKGTYNASTAYTALDFVQYDGSSYVALKSVQGVTPSNDGTNWQYLARGTALALQDNLLTTTPGQYALDARQGSVIKSSLDSLNDSLATNLQTSIVKISKGASTEHTFTVPSSSRHFVIFACAWNTAYWIGYIHGASAGAVSANEIAKGSQISDVNTSTNTLKFTTGSNTSGVLIDIVIYGNAMS